MNKKEKMSLLRRMVAVFVCFFLFFDKMVPHAVFILFLSYFLIGIFEIKFGLNYDLTKPEFIRIFLESNMDALFMFVFLCIFLFNLDLFFLWLLVIVYPLCAILIERNKHSRIRNRARK
jgi:hypothetical protein